MTEPVTGTDTVQVSEELKVLAVPISVVMPVAPLGQVPVMMLGLANAGITKPALTTDPSTVNTVGAPGAVTMTVYVPVTVAV